LSSKSPSALKASVLSIPPARARSGGTTAAAWGARLLDRYFYFFMSLLTAAIVIYGFHFTVGKNLFHPAPPRPLVLYFHAAVFSFWVVFFILQSSLVRTGNVRVHRIMGWFGLALGIGIIVLGVSTAVTMARFDLVQLHALKARWRMIVPLFDMVCFTPTFLLAIYWRRKPQLHRRLIFIATCGLTAAAWARFPENILPHNMLYAGVDLLILLGVARDLIVERRIHTVYQYALPLLIIGQSIVVYTRSHELHYWLRVADFLLR
jgi:hypothetical protein